MDREIKFRAWGKSDESNRKVMAQVGLMNTYNDFGYEYQTFWTEAGIMNGLGRESAVLMQYTGLKDKNGVEIYEGDIVQTYGSDPSGRLGKNKLVEIKWASSPRGTTGFNMGSGKHGCDHREVIGNIYENPELLEKNNEN